MGSSSSSHQQYPNDGHDMGRGWTQSFPRELSRQHGQPVGRKVLPEPPNQRLRATNNGSIIHNGGTISGRRPAALTLPHDLNKQGAFRNRNGSQFGPAKFRRSDHRCCHYQSVGDSHCMDNEMQELKRFGSEPDLRYSPTERIVRAQTSAEHRHNGVYYPERDTRERESRYNRAKKKYKAPPPPATNEESSPDSYKWESDRFRPEPEVQPPPRKSRLFKTRAETKRAQVNWTSSPRTQDPNIDEERRCRSSAIGEQNGKSSRGWSERDHSGYGEQRLYRDEHIRHSKNLIGKNTLQRSMSSPEFQAELMQVARKVRNKLNFTLERGREPESEGEQKRIERQEMSQEEDNCRLDSRTSRSRQARRLIVERRCVENKEVHEERRSKYQRELRSKECFEERQVEIQKSTTTVQDHSYDRKCDPIKESIDIVKDRQKTKEESRSRQTDLVNNVKRSRSANCLQYNSKERFDVRGQGSGRESTPESNEHKKRNMELDFRLRKNEFRVNKNSEKMWSEQSPVVENRNEKSVEKTVKKDEKTDKNWYILQSTERTTPKTFYFGMDETLTKEQNITDNSTKQFQERISNRGHNRSPDSSSDDVDENKSNIEDISLKLRPTLPKKQLEIPRFSPSAAWRLLSAMETSGPTMSTASEEIPLMCEERIERMARPPPPLVALSPRSSHDKSGDSGISGDAGAGNDDSLEVSTTNRLKSSATRAAWTPQQDLGEESSSDAGVDSPPPMLTPAKFPPRAHVFSLSLPREDNRMYLYNPDGKSKDGAAFNSLKKLKRSVSGAFGLASMEQERKTQGDVLDDNWLLSTSAPTSLQHSQMIDVNQNSNAAWKSNYYDDEDNEETVIPEDRTDFPVVMKPPSFSYLASGGHVMYLPNLSGTDYQPHSLNCRTTSNIENDKNSNENDAVRQPRDSNMPPFFRERSFISGSGLKAQKLSNISKSCENISEMNQRSELPRLDKHDLRNGKENIPEMKVKQKPQSKSRRFTFQSTVRQIERRRLAEKLSREAEAKERQRKGELEAMRKVEEEFQRKRAREKANIRQQLRLYSMEENLSNLPPTWDSSHGSRADPEGAPSSSASSPTSAPPGKLLSSRKNSVSSDEYNKKTASNLEHRSFYPKQHREYKDYRPKYYDWATETSPHPDYKHTTVHPKIVYDIPKSSAVFVDANVHGTKSVNANSTPRTDNYRKDFAHGAIAAKSSLASSDSELSQPNTRPHSRQAKNKIKPVRSRSASPDESEEVVSSEDESPLEAVKQERNPINGFILNGVQPFVREKSYRPITFNPQPPPPVPS